METTLETELERFSKLEAGGERVRAQNVAWTASNGDATATESAALNLKPGTAVYRLETVWRAQNGAAACETVTASASRFPDLPRHLSGGGQFLFPLYRLQYREAIGKVSESLRCVNADQDIADQLGVPRGQALLYVSRVAFNVSAEPVEWSQRSMHLANAEYVVAMG